MMKKATLILFNCFFSVALLCMENNETGDITLVSKEGHEILVPLTIVHFSNILSYLYEDLGNKHSIRIDNINERVLNNIILILKEFNRIIEANQSLNSVYNDQELTKQEIEKELLKVGINRFKKYKITDLKDILVTANFLDIPVLINPASFCFGEWIFAHDWALNDPLFAGMPKKIKYHSITNFVENAPLRSRIHVHKCRVLACALAYNYRENQKQLSFDQCLTCIEIIRGKKLDNVDKKFEISNYTYMAIKNWHCGLDRDLCWGELTAIKFHLNNSYYFQGCCNHEEWLVTFIIACDKGNLMLFKYIFEHLNFLGLSKKYLLELQTKKRVSLLMYAAVTNNIDICRFLIAEITNLGMLEQQLNASDIDGLTLRQWAKTNTTKTAAYLKSLDL